MGNPMTRHKRKVFLLPLLMMVITAVAVGQQPAQEKAPPATSETQKATKTPPPSSDTPKTAQPVDPKTYKIGPGDLLSISVWKEPELTQKVPVRPDGMTTLPLVGDVKAAGMTPLELQSTLEEKLKGFISSPAVTVVVEEVRSKAFNVLGQVQRPGLFGLAGHMTVLDGLAAAGGFKDFAKTKKIYVMRKMPDGTVQRLPFNYKEVIKGKNTQQNVELEPQDTIIVP